MENPGKTFRKLDATLHLEMMRLISHFGGELLISHVHPGFGFAGGFGVFGGVVAKYVAEKLFQSHSRSICSRTVNGSIKLTFIFAILSYFLQIV